MALLTSLLGWAWNNKRLAVEIALVAAIVVYGYLYHKKKQELRDAATVAAGLEAGLREKITIANDEIEILRRENGHIVLRREYVPPEGSVVIKKKELADQRKALADVIAALQTATFDKDAIKRRLEELMGSRDENAEGDEIIIKDKGFTFRPGYGLDFANAGIKPRLDFKFAYWKRWSLILGGSPNGAGPGISRHVDDIIWSKLKNVEAFAGYNFVTFDGRQGKYGVIGIRSNF